MHHVAIAMDRMSASTPMVAALVFVVLDIQEISVLPVSWIGSLTDIVFNFFYFFSTPCCFLGFFLKFEFIKYLN